MNAIGIVIPAYQAASTIAEVVRRIRLDEWVAGIVVVDDGSTDGTGDAARRAGAHVVSHGENRGKGAALMTGFRTASALAWNAAVTLDADGQHDPAAVPLFAAAFRATGAAIVVGSRARGGSLMPLPRRLSNGLSSAVVSRLAGCRIPDSQSGYRLVAREVWEKIPLCREGYDFESEMLIKAGRRGFRIVSLPIETIYGDESSHFRALRDTLRMMRLFWSLFAENAG